MKNVENSNRGRSQGIPKIFRAPIYRAHCAVIFVIAQLSCSSLKSKQCSPSQCCVTLATYAHAYVRRVWEDKLISKQITTIFYQIW